MQSRTFPDGSVITDRMERRDIDALKTSFKVVCWTMRNEAVGGNDAWSEISFACSNQKVWGSSAPHGTQMSGNREKLSFIYVNEWSHLSHSTGFMRDRVVPLQRWNHNWSRPIKARHALRHGVVPAVADPAPGACVRLLCQLAYLLCCEVAPAEVFQSPWISWRGHTNNSLSC